MINGSSVADPHGFQERGRGWGGGELSVAVFPHGGSGSGLHEKFLKIWIVKYRKIPIISPGLIFVQKAFSPDLFSGEPIFGGDSYRKEFCVSKWVWLVNKLEILK